MVDGNFNVDDFFEDTNGYTYATIFVLWCYKYGKIQDRGIIRNRNIYNIALDFVYVTMSKNEFYNREFCSFLDSLNIGWVENGNPHSNYIDGREVRPDSPYFHPNEYEGEKWFSSLYVKYLKEDKKYQWLVKEIEEEWNDDEL